MRVAHVITRLILGGAQENTLFNCEDLLRHYGDEVLLITGPAVGPEGSLLERAERSGVPLAVIPALQRAIHPWHDWRASGQLKRVLREFRPDVVHTHSAKGGLLGRAAAWRLGVPAVIHTVHGAPYYPYQSKLAQKFIYVCERWAAKRCDALISVADAMTEMLVRDGVAPREKFTTIYSGMEVDPFLHGEQHRQRMRAELGFGSEVFVIGKIARLFHLKGHEFVIAAAKQVVKLRSDVRFLFVGDGILREQLEREVRDAGLSAYFHFAGLVPPEQIPAYLSAMDALVHTSLREGLARALPQALISGKPALSYDIDGAREVVITDETGILLPPQEVDGLAAAIVRLAANRDEAARMGAEGRRRFADVFRHERMTERIRSVYERVLDSKDVERKAQSRAGDALLL
ncbi:MAG: glycosyltransferase family 4 protein [Pirellulales bacterium]|nr:glycosyltransferase family 4 protein [Pirellulales bacterium]